MLKITTEHQRSVVLLGLMLIAAGLPLSVFMVSVGQFVLLAGWLLQGRYIERLRSFFTDPLSLIIISSYLILVIGMLHTEDTATGFKWLRIRLPVLMLPLLLFTSVMPDKKRLQDVLLTFVLAVFLTSVLGYIDRYHFGDPNPLNKRDLSVFISHIRFGLMVVLSMFILGYHLVAKRNRWSITEKVLSVSVILWLFYFLVLLESPSAYLAFVILLGFTLIRSVVASNRKDIKVAAIIIILLGGISSSVYVLNIYRNHMLDHPFDYRTLTVLTDNGRYYGHQTDVPFRENGHRVWNFVCMEELRNEWPKRSGMPFEGEDESGQQLKFTLVRYMTSKGLKKDSVGVHALTNSDIRNVEKGFTNFRYVDRWGVSRRIDQLLWEAEQYAWNGDPNASSLIQRLTYFQIGLDIVKQNWMVGVGTGDMYDAFRAYYEKHEFDLNEKRQGASHNQFLTTAITLGVCGTVIFLFSLLYPLRFYWKDYLYAAFLLLMLVSMLSDNTLDSQPGATLFAFFNALLIIRKEFA